MPLDVSRAAGCIKDRQKDRTERIRITITISYPPFPCGIWGWWKI